MLMCTSTAQKETGERSAFMEFSHVGEPGVTFMTQFKSNQYQEEDDLEP